MIDFHQQRHSRRDREQLLDRLAQPVKADLDVGKFTSLAQKLVRNHRIQWDAEDVIRSKYDDDHTAASLKRRIDELNSTRVSLVGELDQMIACSLIQTNPYAPLHTETIGSVIDRLIIASIRVQSLYQKLFKNEGEESRSRFEAASQQLEELSTAYDTLVSEVRSGKRRVPAWRALKTYNESQRNA
jgi:hypothetical protein